jgi:RNA polymerase sigma-70 factor (ECF subfamily)
MEKFGAFFARHRERLFGYLMRLTGDYHLSADLLQESFTRYLSSYGNQSQNLTLLYKIARNALLDIRRRQSRAPGTNEEPADPRGDPERRLLVREEYQQMMTALGRLRESDREILALAATGDLKYRQIAEILSLNENAVKVRIHRARIRLRQILEEMNNERPFDQHFHR